jgi:hypothetical protein
MMKGQPQRPRNEPKGLHAPLRYTRLMFTEYIKRHMQLPGYGLAMEGLALRETLEPPR